MAHYTDLVKQALVFDSETTSLGREAVMMHSAAILDLEEQKVYEYIIEPHLLIGKPATKQDLAKMVSSGGDVFEYVPGITSSEQALKKQVEILTGARVSTQAELDANLRWSNSFLLNNLEQGRYPHLRGGPLAEVAANQQRQVYFKQQGVRAARLGNRVSMKQMIESGGILQRHMAGKTVWIANAVFEAKQFGAHIAAEAAQGNETMLKTILETYNPDSPDPFYVTGAEVNRARTTAQITGDWTQVWKAYLKYTPAAGETAVRDIQDVSRAMMSYGRKLGVFEGGSHYFGTGIDVSKRLFASLKQGSKGLAIKELHRSAEDTVDEKNVLKRVLQYTDALAQVADNTMTGRTLLEQAQKGKGLFAEAAEYFARLEAIAPQLQEVNLVKRLARAQEDILREGMSVQTLDPLKVLTDQQQTPSGKAVGVQRLLYDRTQLKDMDAVIQHVTERGDYADFGVDVEKTWARMQASMAGATDDAGRIRALKIWTDTTTNQMLDDAFEQLGKNLGDIGPGKALRFQSAVRRHSAGTANAMISGVLDKVKGRSAVFGGMALGVAAFAGIAGVGASARARNAEELMQPSLLSYGYDEWIARQRQEGMQEGGTAAQSRKRITDFGSPYQGQVGSANVFVDQQLLNEREKWLRAQYGATHYDPSSGLFGAFSPFSWRRPGYNYVQDGYKIAASRYQGMRGNNLMGIDLSNGNWKVEATDADTIVIKKGGIRGAMTGFFGMNRSYSFRVAGVDAPETSHGSTSYHAPQPYAQEAAAALQMMLKGSKSMELVYDPTRTTYGRMLGTVIADGKNLSFEMVKQGVASHLPYDKPESAIIDYAALKRAEEHAFAANRGMWQTPWAKTFYTATEQMGKRITFNTFTNTRSIAQNSGSIAMLSLMENAQDSGEFSSFHKSLAQEIGQNYRVGADPVGPTYYEQANKPHNNYMDEMMRDNARFIKTKGRGNSPNKLSRKSGYGRLDSTMALDTMGQTNSIWNKKRLELFKAFRTDKRMAQERKMHMASEQRRINNLMFQSPIGHHRM